ncbi:MAG: arsenate reductase family protein [Deinococcales bacterium]
MEAQVFGIQKSQETRAAERFFKERKVRLHLVDLLERPIARGELKRFVDKFGWDKVLDRTGRIFIASGLEHMKLSEDGWLAKIQDEPRLLNLPLVRVGKNLAIGRDEAAWKLLLAA